MARPPVTPLTPWRWLQQAIALLRAQPRALVGATSLLLAVVLAPSVVQLSLANSAPQLAQVLVVVLALLVFPPVVAGFFRIVHQLAQGGEAPPPSAIFAVFGDGATVRRAILANVLCVLGTLLLLTLLVSLFGGEALLQYMDQLSRLPPGTREFPPMPAGMLPLLVALLIASAALGTVQALAFAELALAGRAPLAAIWAALRALGRHFGVLLLFYVPIAVFAFLVFMFFVLIAVLLGSAVAALVPALGSLLVTVLAVLLVLAMYSLLFTFFYFAWRELLSEASAPPPSSAPHEIAA
jgi:hypothetical protein